MKQRLLRLLMLATLTLGLATLAQAEDQERTRVIMTTNMGEIVIELFDDEAPITVANFLSYVESGFYDGSIFHRVIPDFMVQGGGFGPNLQRLETLAPIQNEADNGLRNDRGTLAMARTNQVNSATSQFFINVADNDFLNHGVRDFGYAVFGQVVEGMDIVDDMSKAPTRRSGDHANLPRSHIVIESAIREAMN